ncbi:Cation/H(+) antiporter 15 [Senna tora]|uniref:Cation/H(+) antiporter 15 n=1 Tax=Senna tora TaxID=362788 RepID=A0A834ST83_9FABA|nr:Cation/H(+) antiporter 15 [Senna tora]
MVMSVVVLMEREHNQRHTLVLRQVTDRVVHGLVGGNVNAWHDGHERGTTCLMI